MEKDIAEGKIGNVGGYDLEFKEGKLRLSVDVAVGPLTGKLMLEGDAAQAIDFAAQKIPGKIDDAILGVVKAAVLGV